MAKINIILCIGLLLVFCSSCKNDNSIFIKCIESRMDAKYNESAEYLRDYFSHEQLIQIDKKKYLVLNYSTFQKNELTDIMNRYNGDVSRVSDFYVLDGCYRDVRYSDDFCQRMQSAIDKNVMNTELVDDLWNVAQKTKEQKLRYAQENYVLYLLYLNYKDKLPPTRKLDKAPK